MQGLSFGVFADFLNVSCFNDETFIPDALSVIDQLGTVKVNDDLWRCANGGTIKRTWMKQQPRQVLSLSGRVLEQLREDALLHEFVGTLYSVPCRIAQLHVTRDEYPENGPERIAQILALGRAGCISVGRKSVPATEVHFENRLRFDGATTGTVYFGKRHKKRLSMHVYDKRNERIDRGYPDPGRECVRVECVARQGKACLRDIIDPAPLFYTLASDIVDRPRGVGPWEPSEFFTMPVIPREPLPVDDRIQRTLYACADLRRLARLVANEPPQLQGHVSRLLTAEFSRLLAQFAADKADAA